MSLMLRVLVKKRLSCLHTSLLVQESVAYAISKGDTVHAAFLDTKKAFDSVWTDGLLYKLYMKGFNRRSRVLIRSSYENFACAAYVNGEIGKWFYTERGVHQGAPMSMVLYVIFINDLLSQICASNLGLSICDINCSSPAHADDVALISLHKSCLNSMLDICYQYSKKWRYNYNEEKTIYIMWGKNDESHVQVKFGGKVLTAHDTCKHMGVLLHNNGYRAVEEIHRRIGVATSVLNAARGLGS